MPADGDCTLLNVGTGQGRSAEDLVQNVPGRRGRICQHDHNLFSHHHAVPILESEWRRGDSLSVHPGAVLGAQSFTQQSAASL